MNVKTIRCLHFVFAFVLLATSAKALTCFQGQRLVEDGKEVSNNFTSRSCSDPNAICHRYYISASLLGSTATVEQGTCLSRESCDLANCDTVENVLQEVLPGAKINTCEYRCCDTDNCNHASGLTFRSWMIFTLPLLAFVLHSLF